MQSTRGTTFRLICLTAEGEFYNPYVQRTMTVSMRLENFPIGQDVESTPYGYLLNEKYV